MDATLPESALPAWRAYLAMERSKREHFALLEALDAKRRRGQTETFAEHARLATLLAEHDGRVAEFRAAVSELRRQDPDAQRVLIEHITRFNSEREEDRGSTLHRSSEEGSEWPTNH